MKNLCIPTNLGIELIDKIIENKSRAKKAIFAQLRNGVNDRYEVYSENRGELSVVDKIENWSEKEKKLLLSCYGNNKEFNVARKNIMDMQEDIWKARCPYCGISEPKTIEHYLPKDDYPEFAVYGLNLIPCCSICNSYKGEEWKKSGERLFINFYFDEIPMEKLLYAYLEYTKDDLIPNIFFKLIRNKRVDDSAFRRIRSHFDRLHLLSRYADIVNEEYTNIFQSARIHIERCSEESYKESLLEIKESMENRYGINYWKVALYEAIAHSDDFFSRCHS